MKKGHVTLTEKENGTQVELDNPWQVVLFNDSVHTFDEVILQVQKATGYSLERATQITLSAHKNGKSVAYIGSKDDCVKVAGVLKQIQLMAEVEKT